jgi:hypothetical protein
MVSGFDRLCWEGLAVCLTGPFLFAFTCSFRLFGGGAVGEGCVVLKGNGLVVGEHIGSSNASSCVGSDHAGMCALNCTYDVSPVSAQRPLDVCYYLVFTYASLLRI